MNGRTLEHSPVVANCRMNRERDLRGRNGYDQDLRFDPLDVLNDIAEERGQARWLDLCCGTATALVQAAELIEANSLPIEIVGVDLVGMFRPCHSNSVTLIESSVEAWTPPTPFDLITSVHGLHYIGDKLRLLKRATSWLTPHGRFVANIDPDNLKLAGTTSPRVILAALRQAGFEYQSRYHVLTRRGHGTIELPFRFVRADDTAGPNYTGQPAVNSHYVRRTPE